MKFKASNYIEIRNKKIITNKQMVKVSLWMFLNYFPFLKKKKQTYVRSKFL